MSLLRGNEPEDYVQDAFVWIVLLHLMANEGQNSVETGRFVDAMQLHFRLLEVEGVSLREYHFFASDREHAIRGTLSRAVIAGVMYCKTVNDGRHHFEHGFRRFAEKEIRDHLDQDVIEKANIVMETTAEMYRLDRDWGRMLERVEEYKRKKRQSEAPATT
ncbi:hypothetical protein KW796_00255 [Candidatus Parcubacteria bacterium]|nr:hypothetical protein [Candidatus Parcubacteria bacterium]